jgi:SAM-dependent methyltransferase
VLDLGTGAGRHAIELARRGFRVTGVDRTERYLGRARVAAAAAGVAVELVAEDMRRFARPQAFDAALNLFTSFGYFDDAGDDLSVARNLCESLVPGGAALFELMGKEVLAGIFRERDWHELVDGFLLEERRVSEGWSGLDLRWVVVRAGTARELRLRHRLYSGAELRALLREAGFASVDLYGSLAGGPYDRSATRLVAVARAD